MGLEVSTYIDGLTVTWPASGDQRKQGDDHLRLIKSVLKNTFPNADRAFRFFRVLSKTAAYSVAATDDNALILVNASGGAFALTLPAVPSTPFKITVLKIGSDTNAVSFVGTVNGGTATSLTAPGMITEIYGDGTSYHQPVGPLPISTNFITANAVTLAKLVNASAQGRLLGRKTASAGNWEEVTPSEILNTIASVARGDILLRGAANWDRKALGTIYKALVSDGTDLNYAYPRLPLFHFRKESTNGTNGQTMSASTWNQLTFDATLTNEITGASLGTNQFTLPAGTFSIKSFPGFRGSDNGILCQARLRNITDTTTTLRGATFDSGTGGGAIFAPLWGRFTIAAPKTFQVQLWVGAGAGTAIMQASSSGEGEVYNETQIEQIA